MARLTLKIILMTCVGSLLVGCSTVISHSQSGDEENIYAKRSLGTAIDDNAIVGRIESKLRTINEQFASMVQVDAYNKIVLLTGRVPDQSFIDKAVEIASSTPGVRQVHLEISNGQETTISNYWYDAWLTTKVKSQLTLTSNAPASKTKVRSFAGYVYLMGVMTPQEAKNAIYVASRIPGAKKVISLIETVDNNGRAIVSTPPSSKKKSATRPVADTFETQQEELSNEYNYTPPQEVEYLPAADESPAQEDQYSDSGYQEQGATTQQPTSGFYTEEPAAVNDPSQEMNTIDPGYETKPVSDDSYGFQNDYQSQGGNSVEPQTVQRN